MTTELLYLQDAYLRSFEAIVVAADDNAIALDRTAFYPGGGGQPPDQGVIGDARVTDVFKDQTGRVWHVVDAPPPPPLTRITGTLDWERRHLLMRTHMALHLVNAVAWIDYQARVTGAHMEPGKGRVDLQLASMSQALGEHIEQRVNEYVERDLPITTIFLPRAEADADPAVYRGRAIPPEEDPVRTVRIHELDRQACSGTHVATTKEIGRIKVTKTKSKGRANKRIEIALSAT
ncbi:alanyl-tRNA editing protein [Solirubrobacter soli]|uniref:alanyl-tRNA editing protein n=1 Tax=Solirubrobacter soli TaxID=363832 RepID=UPI0003F6071D|nr:alanyl-tRNA editing protein [Solirubrobacter soli]